MTDFVYEYTPCCPTGFRQGAWRYNTLLEIDPDAATSAETVMRAVCQGCGRKLTMTRVKSDDSQADG